MRLSGDTSQESGVQEGTVLGPLLFLIMISDINKDFSSSNLISFADDTRIYTHITQIETCDNLQFDLNTIYNWTNCNNMLFNSSKFHCLSFNSSIVSNICNIDYSPDLAIINPSSRSLPFLISHLSKSHICAFISPTVIIF